MEPLTSSLIVITVIGHIIATIVTFMFIYYVTEIARI